jgi:hypothetical protein
VPASARRPASVIVSQVTSIRRLPPGNVPRVAFASPFLTTSVSISSLNPCSIMIVTVQPVVSKRLAAAYRSGPSRDWIKVKNPDSPAMVSRPDVEPAPL